MEPKVYHGKNIDDAVAHACEDLQVAREALHVEVIDLGKRGFWGIGRKPATIAVTFLKDVIACLENPTEIPDQKLEPEQVSTAAAQSKEPASSTLAPIDEAAILKIQTMLNDLFAQSGVKAQVNYQVQGEQIIFKIESEQYKGLIIGKKGKTINSLQALAQAIFSHQGANRYFIILDIDNYRELRSEQIKKWLEQAIKVVQNSGRSYRFSPMIAVERKVMINQISQFPDIAYRVRGTYPRRYIEIYQKVA